MCWQIPVFLRGGYVIPLRERLRRSSTVAPHDPYTLLVALDTQVTGTFISALVVVVAVVVVVAIVVATCLYSL